MGRVDEESYTSERRDMEESAGRINNVYVTGDEVQVHLSMAQCKMRPSFDFQNTLSQFFTGLK